MAHRLASVVLVLLTIAFFAFYKQQNLSTLPSVMSTVSPVKNYGNFIVLNEVLLLMEEGREDFLNKVLSEYNLTLVSPLGEWVHAAVDGKDGQHKVVAFDSDEAKKNQLLALALEAHPDVHSAHLNYIQPSNFIGPACVPFDEDEYLDIVSDDQVEPSDPLLRYQWHLSSDIGIDLPGAWSITKGDAKSVIALVDRNFEFTEDDLIPSRCKSRQYYYENITEYFPKKKNAKKDKSIHGTNVLSVVAPCTDNSLGLAGVDWHAQVFAVDSKSDGSLSSRMFGVMWAAGLDVCRSSIVKCPPSANIQKNHHPANVINASFGFAKGFLKNPPYGPMLDIIGQINRQGRILVASAGNEKSIADRRLPGSAGGVISVGASNKKKQSSNFSNFGRSVDVLAPGEDIIGIKKGKPILLNGTSFSSPIVSGVVSLMLAANSNLSWKHMEHILKSTATPLSCSDYCPDSMTKRSRTACEMYCCIGDKNVCASGIINAKAAVEKALSGIPKTPLIDVDDYFIPLSQHKNFRATVQVKNWGDAVAKVQMKKTNKFLRIFPEKFTIEPISSDGEPATREITLYYDHIPSSEIVMSLILEASTIDKPNDFSDRIEAIVSIVPDIKTHRKLYRELLPKT